MHLLKRLHNSAVLQAHLHKSEHVLRSSDHGLIVIQKLVKLLWLLGVLRIVIEVEVDAADLHGLLRDGKVVDRQVLDMLLIVLTLLLLPVLAEGDEEATVVCDFDREQRGLELHVQNWYSEHLVLRLVCLI